MDVLEGKTVYRGTSEEVRRLEGERQPSFSPCNLFVRAAAFQAVGGYSDEFHDSRRKLYFREDSDFGFRLLDAGFRVGIDDSVVVSHPRQWAGLRDAFRHAQRYVFDPLLARRHPRRYRESIEVKRILGLRVRRVHHWIALISVAGLVTACVGMVSGRMRMTAIGLAAMVVCGLLYRIKYQGFTARRASELFGFIVVPFVYLYSLLRGCLRYKSWRVLM
jgi:GT2 family glycosyltransferase